MNKYNGWSNRETWLVNIWFEPHTQSDLDFAKEQLQESYDSVPDYLKDFINLDIINWNELTQHVQECE